VIVGEGWSGRWRAGVARRSASRRRGGWLASWVAGWGDWLLVKVGVNLRLRFTVLGVGIGG